MSARRLPSYPFPPYSYISVRFPHPLSDPHGHGCPGPTEPSDVSLDENCETFLWACDLFDAGYYWEAHEAWEAVWNLAGRKGSLADFLKGLIKLAAAGVKAREARAAGVRRHARRAEELFRAVRQASEQQACLGLSLDKLIQQAQAMPARAEELVHAADQDFQSPILPPLPAASE